MDNDDVEVEDDQDDDDYDNNNASDKNAYFLMMMMMMMLLKMMTMKIRFLSIKYIHIYLHILLHYERLHIPAYLQSHTRHHYLKQDKINTYC